MLNVKKKTIVFFGGLFIAVILLCPHALFSSQPNGKQDKKKITFRHLTSDDGLPNTFIHCITQDRDGFMWFGTHNGLCRYDGIEIKTWYHSPFNANSLSDSSIQWIYVDKDNMLWCATFQGSITRFDHRAGVFTPIRFDRRESGAAIPNTSPITFIIGDKKDRIWAACGTGELLKINRETNTAEPSTLNVLDIPGTIKRKQVFPDICVSRDGFLWIGSPNGLVKFDPDKEKIARVYRFDKGDPGKARFNNISFICQERSGKIWAGTSTGGIHYLDPDSGEFTTYAHHPDNPAVLYSNFVTAILETHKGEIWIAGLVEGGISIFDRQKKNFKSLKYNVNDPSSLNSDETVSLYQGRSGIIWTGASTNGISFYVPQKEEFVHLLKDKDRVGGFSDNDVRSILEDRRGFLWVGTLQGGVKRINRETNRIRRYNVSGNANPVYDAVISLLEDNNGNLWAGGYSRVYIHDKEKDTFFPFDEKQDPRGFLTGRVIGAMAQDSSGVIWFSTFNSGAVAYNPVKKTLKRYAKGKNNTAALSHNRVRTIYPAPDGTLWLGTVNGVNRYNRESDTFTHYLPERGKRGALGSPDVVALCRDHKGNLWLGTFGGGMYKMSTQSDNKETFTYYGVEHGLPDSAVVGIREDRQGLLWISTGRGISRFNPETRVFANYTVNDGLQGNEFTRGATYKSSKGELFFGGLNGLTAFYPKDILKNLHVPPVSIHTVKVFRDLPDKQSRRSAIRELTGAARLVLEHDERAVSFHFAALDFVNPRLNQYACKLEGYDTGWQYTGTRRSVIYTGLAPGDYTFRVKAANNSGVWNEKGASMDITVMGSASTLFIYIIICLLAVSVIFLIISMRRMKKRHILLTGNMEKEIEAMFSRFSFSGREKEIIQLLLEGKSRKEIEDALFVSPHTVKNNIYSIYRKLGVKNRLQVINLLLGKELPPGDDEDG